MTIDWLATLDIKQAVKNCYTDIRGDWFRDPWGWPELSWILRTGSMDFVLQRLNASGVRRASRLDVAKENFSTRPALVIDPVDRLAYQALVDRVSMDIIGGLDSWVYGWRLDEDGPQRAKYASNRVENERYRDHLKRLVDLYSCGLKTDIVSCFPSIAIERVAEEVFEAVGHSKISERLIDMLEAWNRIPDRSGLPQRSMASAVLANMYLSSVDDALRPYNATRGFAKSYIPEGKAVRWMDDIWLFGNDPGRLRKAQLDLQHAMRQVDLDMNLAKTDVYEGEDLEKQVQSLEHSMVDAALDEPVPNLGPLDELIDELTAKPEHAARTSVRFATTRMRDRGLYQRLPDVVDKAERMPQASDHLARLFRDSEAWRDLKEWFVDYAKGNWGAIEWSVAQLATMFPTRARNTGPVADFLAQVLAEHSSLPLLAVAGQRLASWDRDNARFAVREAAQNADNPQQRRALALAALAAGEKRSIIRDLLGEFEENAVTLSMLEDRNFKRLKVTPDFSG